MVERVVGEDKFKEPQHSTVCPEEDKTGIKIGQKSRTGKG